MPEAHNLINPTLNTIGVQCGVTETIPMRVEDTLHHINQQGGVPPARRTRMYVPTPHLSFYNELSCGGALRGDDGDEIDT